MAEQYVSLLLTKHHLELNLDNAGFTKFGITEKGMQLLLFLNEVTKELRELLPEYSVSTSVNTSIRDITSSLTLES